MEYLDTFILVKVGKLGIIINVTDNVRHTTTETVVKIHLLYGTIEKLAGSVGFDTGGKLIDKRPGTLKLGRRIPFLGNCLRNLGYFLDVVGTAVECSNGDGLTGGKLDRLQSGKGGRSLGITKLRIGNNIRNGGNLECLRNLEGGVLTKDLGGIINDGKQVGLLVFTVNECKAVMSSLLNLDGSFIGGFSRHAVEWHGEIVGGVVNSEPTLERTRHLLQAPIQLATDRFHLSQTIKGGKGEGVRSGVGKVDATNKGGKVLFGEDNGLCRCG
mmetsp:Transcript_2168/g.4600  ORF Transcript_2168/g.4600 Transcript_2168/m.4600 type:complete len:271 (-) Transcript_2168:839-1651(-)